MDILSYKLGKNSSGGGGGDLDWSAIGFTGTPQSIIKGYNYAKQIQNTWTTSSSLNRKFYMNYEIVFFPTVDTSSTTDFNEMFYYCFALTDVAPIDTSSATTCYGMFNGCRGLKSVPQLDLSNCTNIGSMFYNCKSLESVPVFNWSKVKTYSTPFSECDSLSDESLNNIMASCISATSISSGKNLLSLGISKAQATRCQSLSNYQAFLNAGWTTGY